jgi:hypothetical protein
MISKPIVLSSNLDFVIYLPFQLNISRVKPHILKENLSPHVKGVSKYILIKFTFSYQLKLLRISNSLTQYNRMVQARTMVYGLRDKCAWCGKIHVTHKWFWREPIKLIKKNFRLRKSVAIWWWTHTWERDCWVYTCECTKVWVQY